MTIEQSPALDTKIHSKILCVGELLAVPKLKIPDYQRPYKWTGKNIEQLFGDIATFSKESCQYRLGTVVFHQKEEGEELNIVDGQQRIVTLILIIRALHTECENKLKGTMLWETLSELAPKLRDLTFPSEISHKNTRENFQQITRIVTLPEFTEAHIDFLLNRCEVVTFTLSDISEAFQFFDSQNARGRDLEPHDLLKAYHLREFAGNESEAEKECAVESWENSTTEKLAVLFEQYLYRIRNWARSASARSFGKSEIALFKGINLQTSPRYPYMEPLRIAHHFIDRYREQYERKIDDRTMPFPFQLDQIIINGRRFFEMTAHYQMMIALITDREPLAFLEVVTATEDRAVKILNTINDYDGSFRTGDKHVRSLFDNLLIYYYDKFGTAELSQAIVKIFIWSYSLRLRQSRVSLASVDNYVLEKKENNLFRLIKESIEPGDFLSRIPPFLSKNESTQTKKIEDLFREMGYFNEEKKP